jgi:mRNA-degrading endonuclease RelE of RelBE toxin-antitoxin system
MKSLILNSTPLILDVAIFILDVSTLILNLTLFILDVSTLILDVTPLILDLTPFILDSTALILDLTPLILDSTALILDLTLFILDVSTLILDVARTSSTQSQRICRNVCYVLLICHAERSWPLLPTLVVATHVYGQRSEASRNALHRLYQRCSEASVSTCYTAVCDGSIFSVPRHHNACVERPGRGRHGGSRSGKDHTTMYDIDYTQEALEDLQWFRKHEQNIIVDGIDQQLRNEPTSETRNRKRMQVNAYAEWELRIGDVRVLYNVDTQVRIVEIQRIGEKRGNTFFFRGRRTDI